MLTRALLLVQPLVVLVGTNSSGVVPQELVAWLFLVVLLLLVSAAWVVW